MTEVGYVLTVIPAAGAVGFPGTTKAALEERVRMMHGTWCLGRLFPAPSKARLEQRGFWSRPNESRWFVVKRFLNVITKCFLTCKLRKQSPFIFLKKQSSAAIFIRVQGTQRVYVDWMNLLLEQIFTDPEVRNFVHKYFGCLLLLNKPLQNSMSKNKIILLPLTVVGWMASA